jgi:hypothetical protein
VCTTERLADELPAGRAALGDATRTSLPTPASAGGATVAGATAGGGTASRAAASRATAGGATPGGTDLPATDAETAQKIAETVRPHDIALVMRIGLAAAGITGAAALRHIRGSSIPFAVPVALVALKLPTGALTALLGLLLINGGFIPGLSALDSPGQFLAWALVFGAAQQLVTGLVDKKAQSVLDSVGSAPMTEQE